MKQILTILSCCFLWGVLPAQELNFSQYIHAPLLINPANTGFAPDADYRIGGNYRTQWSSVGTPYNTMHLWGDMQLFGDKFENGWVGAGFGVLRDVAGSGTLTSTRAFGSIAYHQLLGYKGLLSLGFNVGYVDKRINISKLSFNNQWNGQFFDVNIPSNEPFIANQVGYLDLQVGLNYSLFASENLYLNFGLSGRRINRPVESFFAVGTGDQRVQPQYTAFFNASYKTNDNLWILNPNVYVNKVSNQTEVVAGMNAQRNISGDGYTQMLFGVYYRMGDAFIPMVGYQVNDLRMTINYDATISTLQSFNGTRGAYEISLVKSGLLSGDKSVKCPTVRF